MHGWRHTEGRVCGVDIIEPVDLVAEASGRSPSTTPEGPAQPGHRQRVGGQSRLSRHMRSWLRTGKPQTISEMPAAQARWLSVPPSHRRWSAATTAFANSAFAISGNQHNCPSIL